MFDWSKQTILITGGTGSFGHEFVSQVLKKKPKAIRIFSRDEYKQYVMQQEYDDNRLRYFIGDIRDEERVRRALDGVTMVVHAAAMKQIVASEYNPTEAVKTNILGTMSVMNACIDMGVGKLIGLITDKAVSPTNLYGGTKLVMEKLLIQGNSYRGKGDIRISCVRYGNVAGSRGSVIPKFLEQKKSGTLTITHKDMTRFWLTLSDAVEFVTTCIETMRGGEVFIPKMPKFKVEDLAHAIAPEAKIKYVGIRPGEKIHEDLINIHESLKVREYKDHYILEPEFDFWDSAVSKKDNGTATKKPFNYSSNTGQSYLSVATLRSLTTSLRHTS